MTRVLSEYEMKFIESNPNIMRDPVSLLESLANFKESKGADISVKTQKRR